MRHPLGPSRIARTQDKPPAVVLGGGHVQVAVVRSLARAGVRTVALGDRTDPARHSRSCHSFVDLGSGDDVQERWLEYLLAQRLGAVVFPAHDHGLELVARNRSTLIEAGYQVIEADDRVLLDMLDKDRTYELSRGLGIPAPKTLTIRGEGELEQAMAEMDYPCAVKPLHSHRFLPRFKSKLLVAEDPDMLRSLVAQTTEEGLDMMVTEIVPGRDERHFSYYTYLDASGEPVFHFTKQKVRQFPVYFGIGCYHVTNHNLEVAALGLRFFQGVGVRGIANVEFKEDARDGSLKLIECNHRLTSATAQIVAAGLDLPLLVYNRTVGLDDPPLDSYRDGLHLWYPIQDFGAFCQYRRRGELSLTGWIRSLLGRIVFPVARWDDPMPTIMFHVNALRRRVRSRTGGRAQLPAGPGSDRGFRGRSPSSIWPWRRASSSSAKKKMSGLPGRSP